MPSKPQLECPACGSDRVLPIVYGFPRWEVLEMAKRGLVALGGCTIDDFQEPVWVCDACHHQWGDLADEESLLLQNEVFQSLESLFEITSLEDRKAEWREREFDEFVRTVIPQAIRENASAIVLEQDSLHFVIESKRILVDRVLSAGNVINAFDKVIERHSSPNGPDGPLVISVYPLEGHAKLGLARIEGGGIKISLLSHDLPDHVLADVRRRPRPAFCPYCGDALLAELAKQCFQCGMDWHDPDNPVRR